MSRREVVNALVLLGGLGALCALSQCETKGSVDLGDNDANTSEQTLAVYAGNWDGYVEGYAFQSGSDRLRIILDQQGKGMIHFGDGQLVATPTDPNAPYPSGWSYQSPCPPEHCQDNLEQFVFPIHDANVTAGRVRFDWRTDDFWAAWCVLQTPTTFPPLPGTTEQVYSCGLPPYDFVGTGYIIGSTVQGNECTYQVMTAAAAAGGASGAGGGGGTRGGGGSPQAFYSATIDCEKLLECRHCDCTADACAVHVSARPNPMPFDAALENDGKELVGTVLLNGLPYTARLQRQ